MQLWVIYKLNLIGKMPKIQVLKYKILTTKGSNSKKIDNTKSKQSYSYV